MRDQTFASKVFGRFFFFFFKSDISNVSQTHDVVSISIYGGRAPRDARVRVVGDLCRETATNRSIIGDDSYASTVVLRLREVNARFRRAAELLKFSIIVYAHDRFINRRNMTRSILLFKVRNVD